MYAYSLPGEPRLTLEEFLQAAHVLCDDVIGKYYKFAAARGISIGKLGAHLDPIEIERDRMSRAFGGIASGKYTEGQVENFILAGVKGLETLSSRLDGELEHLEVPLPPDYTPIFEAVGQDVRSSDEGRIVGLLLRAKGRAKRVCSLNIKLSVSKKGKVKSGEIPSNTVGSVLNGAGVTAQGPGLSIGSQPALSSSSPGLEGFDWGG